MIIICCCVVCCNSINNSRFYSWCTRYNLYFSKTCKKEGKKEREEGGPGTHPPFGAFDLVAFVEKVVCVC
jgi:hypothetical protein